jgi:hypothetical protein
MPSITQLMPVKSPPHLSSDGLHNGSHEFIMSLYFGNIMFKSGALRPKHSWDEATECSDRQMEGEKMTSYHPFSPVASNQLAKQFIIILCPLQPGPHVVRLIVLEVMFQALRRSPALSQLSRYELPLMA